MSFETTVLLTSFVLVGASVLLSSRRQLRHTAAMGRRDSTELDSLFRPALLFRTTPQVAEC